MKKLLFSILIVLMALSCTLFACNQPAKGKIEFTQEEISIELFDTAQLVWTTEDLEEPVTLTSSNTSVATVTNNGKVAAVGKGEAIITAKSGNVKDTVKVTVTDYDPAKLEFYYALVSVNVYEGETITLDPVILYDGNQLEGGVFAYTASEDGNVTLTGNVVTAVNKGVSVVTIKATYNGIELGEIEVEIVVNEKLELDFASYNETLYIYAGSQGQNAPLSFDLTPNVKLNNVAVENAEVQYVIADDSVVEIKDGKVVAKALGETTITATYTTAKGTSATKTINVIVEKPTATIQVEQDARVEKNYEENYNLTLDYAISEIASINVGGSIVKEFTYENKVLTFASKYLINYKDESSGQLIKDHVLTINADGENEKFVITQNVEVVDFAIKTADDFNAWVEANRIVNGVETWYGTLTSLYYSELMNDIDLAELDITVGSTGSDENGCVGGVLEGNGKTITNYHHNTFGLFSWADGFVLRNIGFVDAYFTKAAGGAYFWQYNNKNTGMTYENCFIHIKGDNANGQVGFRGSIDNYYNCVIIVDTPATANISTYPPAEALNTYVISARPAFGVALNSAYELREHSATAYENGFNKEIWNINNGVLMFNSAEQYLAKYVETESKLDLTNFILQDDAVLVIEGAYTLKTNLTSAKFELVGEAIEGVTLEGAFLTISKVALGKSFTIKAISFDSVYGKEIVDQVTITVSGSETIVVEGVKTVALNKTVEIEADLAQYNLTKENIKAVSQSGVAIETGFDMVDGKFVLDSKKLAQAGESKITVTLEKDAIYYNVEINVFVYDYMIATASELGAFIKAGTGTSSSAGKAVMGILTQNIDFAGGYMYDYNTHYFYGSLDGAGYTVSDIHTRNGVFWGLADGAVVKNIAFVNVYAKEAYTGACGLLSWNNQKATIENVYVQGDLSVCPTGGTTAGLGWNASALTIRNFVIDVNLPQDRFAISGEESLVDVQNVFALAPKAYNITGKDSALPEGANVVLYKSVEDYKAAAESMIAVLGTEYWTISNGYVIFKTAEATEIIVNDSVFLKDEDKLLVATNSDYVLTANVDAAFELVNAIEGVAIENGKLVIGAVATGTEITIKATYTTAITGAALEKEITVRVAASEAIASPEKQIAIKTKDEKVVADVASYGFTKENIQLVIAGTEIISADKYDIVDGKVEIDAKAIVGGVDKVLTVSFYKGGVIYNMNLTADVVDFAIASLEDWNEWQAAIKNTAIEMYVTLETDIDLSENVITTASGKVKGVFDGKGHTVKLIVKACGWLHSAYGITFKNVAFDIENNRGGNSWGGLFLNSSPTELEMFVFENCYIKYTTNINGLKHCWNGGNDGWTVLRNCIVEATHTAASTNGVFRQEVPRVYENTYTICSTGNPLATNATTGEVLEGAVYASYEDLKAAVTDWSAFENAYWDLSAGYPVWKAN